MKNLYPMLARAVAAPRSWLRSITERNRLEAEMEAELADHLHHLTADLIRAGLKPAEAKRRARIALGSTVVHKDAMRASLGLRLWDDLGADLRYAARRLRRSVGFTAVAAISLALAIGANTTIFSLAKQLLYERLNVPHPADLRLFAWSASENVAVHSIWGDYDHLPDSRITSTAFSYPVYEQLRAQNHAAANGAFDDLFAFKEGDMNATIQNTAQQVRTEMVSGNYYSALGIQPILGRAILPSDETSAGAGAVAVLSHELWVRQFASSPTAIGQHITMNNIPLTIIGINPKGFTGAKNVQQSPDLFVPLALQPLVSHSDRGSLLISTRMWWVNIMGRMRPGRSDQAVQVALNGELAAIVRGTMPVRPNEDLPVLDLRDGSRGLFTQQKTFAKPMAVLLTMVGFVLLLACVNIANLMLARGTRRHREMSIRFALGAGRTRVIRQILVESLMLAALGGAGGIVVGFFGSNMIPLLTENAWERADFHIHFDWKVFAFTTAITLVTGILFGLAPAFAAAGAKVSAGLQDSSQSVTRRRKGWGGKSLVGFQIALSTLLVIGAGLFLRTLSGLKSVPVGFRTDHLLLAEIDPSSKWYPAGKDVLLHSRLEQAFAAIPGVESVSPASVAYLSDDISMTDFLPEGEAFDHSKPQAHDYNVVGVNFFSTMQIPILRGRAFGSEDTATSTKVGIINESLARKRFPNQDPIGKRFTTDAHDSDGAKGKLATQWIRIVGIAADTSYQGLREVPPPQFFVPYVQQTETDGMTYEIRTQMDPAAIVPSLRRALQQQDPNLPLVNVRSQDQQIDADLQQERVFVTLTSGFGMLALALASVGIYGVMAYSVANRTNEIGIRLALGAQPRQVLSMILREATWISLAGIVAGLGAAYVLARAIQSMLYGLRPADPVSMLSGALLLIAVGLAASWLPARRAASVQPVEALRHE
jgi:predicted permease